MLTVKVEVAPIIPSRIIDIILISSCSSSVILKSTESLTVRITLCLLQIHRPLGRFTMSVTEFVSA